MKTIMKTFLWMISLLLISNSAFADEFCNCKLTYRITPCNGADYYSNDFQCRKGSTKSTVDSSVDKMSSAQTCAATCKAKGKEVREKLVASNTCKARPGQQIRMVVAANYGSQRLLDESGKKIPGGGIYRRARCPGEKAKKEEKKKSSKTTKSKKKKHKPHAKKKRRKHRKKKRKSKK